MVTKRVYLREPSASNGLYTLLAAVNILTLHISQPFSRGKYYCKNNYIKPMYPSNRNARFIELIFFMG